jgi:hypothetical protein
MHQPTGRVIDVNQRRAWRRSILKPVMFATVDLHEFPDACTTKTRLLNLWRPELPGNSQADGNLESPHRLLGQIDAVLGSELLASQSRSKIRVR